MTFFIQQVFNGIILGSTYSIVALGFSLTFGVLNVLNLAHPEIFMAGAYFGFIVNKYFCQNIVVALLLGAAGSALVGSLMERIALRPVQGKDELAPFVITIGVSIFLQSLVGRIFGYDSIFFPSVIEDRFYDILGFESLFSRVQIIVLITAGIITFVLSVVINKTKIGRMIRAVSEDLEVASAMGVNVPAIMNLTITVASALGGVAGVLIAVMYNQISPFMGMMFGMKGLVILIVGGVGNIWGTLIVGLGLGILEVLSVAYLSSSYKDAIAFAGLIVFLVLKPSGLFGGER